MTEFRPVPGKRVLDPQNRVVTVKRYGTDGGSEYVEVQLEGSYGAHVRLPLSCIRRLPPEDMPPPTDTIIALSRREEDTENLVLRVVKKRAAKVPTITFPEK